jgi:PadR family transcriptional regulator PadR
MSRRVSEGYALRLSAVEEDILTLLVGRELYGLAILEASKSAVGGTKALRPGSLYTALYKMEQKGLVRSWWGSETPAERGHARRRYYTATGLGAEVLAATQLRRHQLAQWQPA